MRRLVIVLRPRVSNMYNDGDPAGSKALPSTTMCNFLQTDFPIFPKPSPRLGSPPVTAERYTQFDAKQRSDSSRTTQAAPLEPFADHHRGKRVQKRLGGYVRPSINQDQSSFAGGISEIRASQSRRLHPRTSKFAVRFGRRKPRNCVGRLSERFAVEACAGVRARRVCLS